VKAGPKVARGWTECRSGVSFGRHREGKPERRTRGSTMRPSGVSFGRCCEGGSEGRIARSRRSSPSGVGGRGRATPLYYMSRQRGAAREDGIGFVLSTRASDV
jgi:hypothetical protein